MCCGDLAALGLQDGSLHVGVGQVNPGSGPGWLQGWSACQPFLPHHQGEVFCIALASSSLELMTKGQSQSLCFSVPRVRFSDLHLQGQLYSAAQVWNSGHSRVLQLMRGRDSSPALMTSLLAPPATSGINGRWGGTTLLTHAAT